MRLLVYEYTCGSSLAEHAKLASLRSEGQAMLRAVLEDLAAIPGVKPVTLLDAEFSLASLPEAVEVRRAHGPDEAVFRELAGTADFTWVIAPESEEILATRCRWVAEAGGRAINCTPAAITLAGDKLAMAETWRSRGLPTPAVLAATETDAAEYPAVWKPRHGAGSQATFLLQGPADRARAAEQAAAEGFAGPALLQRCVPGLPASVAWLVGPRHMLPLLPARQLLSADGRFHYLGGEFPLPAGLAERAVRLSGLALEALPGLCGYVGVDLVLGDAADGSQDWLIELNPRLTTSYLGLRRLARFNLAEAVLAVARGVEPPPLEWRGEVVRFGRAPPSGCGRTSGFSRGFST